MAFAGTRQLESVGNNTVAASPRKNALLDSHLKVAIAIQSSSGLRIFPFGVFTHDYEINVAMLAPTERAADSLQQSGRAATDVLLEPSSNRYQQPPQRDVVGDAWVAHC